MLSWRATVREVNASKRPFLGVEPAGGRRTCKSAELSMLRVPRQLIASFVAMLCLVLAPCEVVGQPAVPRPLSTGRQPARSAPVWRPVVKVPDLSLVAEGRMGRAQPAQRGSSRDSVRNGTIIGAVVGAVALGGFGALLCKLYQEEGGASCLPDTLRVAAIGAAIGAGAGLAIDAALTRRGGVRVGVGVRF